ncbi:MAG: hypothetical protein M0P91_04595 [Sulfuricurvum sp.]|jgi:hypothetical protein|uniref:hypothetical protein n=1 Tax=Sulfuricurvum sp. TaxID=2025608 RepID=UPI0025EB7868|nr:hypothetical protein [Sulfuricurvum sp.]MCK9372454.1 hypothetical protein [Sulfuricurvum sp.]
MAQVNMTQKELNDMLEKAVRNGVQQGMNRGTSQLKNKIHHEARGAAGFIILVSAGIMTGLFGLDHNVMPLLFVGGALVLAGFWVL